VPDRLRLEYAIQAQDKRTEIAESDQYFGEDLAYSMLIACKISLFYADKRKEGDNEISFKPIAN